MILHGIEEWSTQRRAFDYFAILVHADERFIRLQGSAAGGKAEDEWPLSKVNSMDACSQTSWVLQKKQGIDI